MQPSAWLGESQAHAGKPTYEEQDCIRREEWSQRPEKILAEFDQRKEHAGAGLLQELCSHPGKCAYWMWCLDMCMHGV
jgi:hypothetical protein